MAKSDISRAVKGMNDIRPRAREAFLDTHLWDWLLRTAAEVMNSYGFEHVHLPVVEETSLFARGIGDTTDIVSKEMYSFEDRGGRSLTLRPEGTAGSVRAYVEHGLPRDDTLQRWWYFGPMYRAERPQKGRYRQFYQIGAELFGSAEPVADVEMLEMLRRMCDAFGLKDVRIRINSLGDNDSRVAYREALRAYLQAHSEDLCDSCRERMATNPLRILDCKRPGCRAVAHEAPDVFDSLTPTAREHFERVQNKLKARNIPFERDRHLVRGLDYYTGTLFEFTTDALGAQDAILGGGRYDNLVADLGGPPTPAIGFAAGVERLALLCSAQNADNAPWHAHRGPHLYLVPMQGLEVHALRLADKIRASGAWRVEVDVAGGKLKQQMKRADKRNARTALVLGESEVDNGGGKVKDLTTSKVYDIPLTVDAISELLTKLLGAEP